MSDATQSSAAIPALLLIELPGSGFENSRTYAQPMRHAFVNMVIGRTSLKLECKRFIGTVDRLYPDRKRLAPQSRFNSGACHHPLAVNDSEAGLERVKLAGQSAVQTAWTLDAFTTTAGSM